MNQRFGDVAPAWPVANRTAGWEKSFLRVGHGGASAHALANTLPSLALALEMGVDVVEFDVRPCRDELVLAHDEYALGPDGLPRLVAQCRIDDLRSAGATSALSEALDLLKGRALLNLDLKVAGCEEAVLEQLRARAMLGDTLISSLLPESLRRIRALEPAALTGYSYPEDKSGASGKPYLKPVVNGAVVAMRRALPFRLPRMIAHARANAVMLYYRVVSPAAVQAVRALGGKVFVWTLDEPGLLARVHAMGVNGIASNRPELFASLTSGTAGVSLNVDTTG